MSDVTWITIERAEELFFVSKVEIDDLIKRGDLDHKIEDHDGRKLKLLMLHQLTRHFDGRDTRARMTPDDLKDIVKGTASNILYVAAGAALVSAKNLLSREEQIPDLLEAYRDQIRLEQPRIEGEIDRVLSSIYDSRVRCGPARSKFTLANADHLRARVAMSMNQFAACANVAPNLSRHFFKGDPLRWDTFDRCLRCLIAICLLERFRIEVSSWKKNDGTIPLLMALIRVTVTPEPLPGTAQPIIVEEYMDLLLQQGD